MPAPPEQPAKPRPRKGRPARPPADAAPEPGVGELPWTGERLVPAARGDFVAEHLHRYALAADFAAGCEVLDVACGEGYGSAILARVAGHVTGVDNDPTTVAHASAKYGTQNLRFLVGEAEKLPLADHSIDLVVSFETLEHLDDHEAMLGEIKRVLRPNGRLLISTPDTRPYQVVSGKTNPFHVRELDLAGFRKLLARNFRHSAIGLQKSVSGSWVVPQDTGGGAPAEYSGDFARVARGSAGAEAPYVLALASDVPVPPVPSSFFNSTQELVSALKVLESEHKEGKAAYARLEKEFADRTAWAKSLEVEMGRTRDEVRRLQTEAVELKNWARSLDADVRRTRAVVAERTELAEKHAAWAQSLETELRAAQSHFEKLSAEFAERTTWAKSLEEDLVRARAIVAARDHVIEERTAWGRALEDELAKAREIAADRGRQLEERAAWGRTLEDALAKARGIVADRGRQLEERAAWGRALESDVEAARVEVGRLQQVHAEAIAWGRSLETELETSRRDFARLDAEFADRTAWAKALDAELQMTKADRDRLLDEGVDLRRTLAGISAACDRLAGVLPTQPAGTDAATAIQSCHRMIAGLQLDLATKDAELRAALASARHAGWQNESAEAEVRRLGAALRDAQIHLDNLLRRAEQLQLAAHAQSEARLVAESGRREKERELVLRMIELQDLGKRLTSYERHAVCRLLARWFAP